MTANTVLKTKNESFIPELDELDLLIRSRITEEPGVLLTHINKELVNVPYYVVWYRVTSMAKAGFLRLTKGRRVIKCYPAGE